MVKQLIQGVRSPRVWCLFAGLAVVVVFLCLAITLLRSSWLLKIPQENLLLRWNDDYTVVNYKIQRARSEESLVPSLFLVGGSSLREAVHSEKTLGRELEKLLGHSIRVWNLATADQSLVESLKIIEAVSSKNGWVLVGLNPRRLNFLESTLVRRWQRARIWQESRYLNEWMRDRGHQVWGEPLWTFRYFWARYFWAHRSKLLQAKWPHTVYTGPPRFKEKRQSRREQIYAKQWKRHSQKFEQNSSVNVSLLRKLASAQHSSRLKLIFVELPMNPALQVQLQGLRDNFVSSVQQISKQLSVAYLDFSWNPDMQEEHFFDLVHLVGSGRRAFHPIFSRSLSGVLKRVKSSDKLL